MNTMKGTCDGCGESLCEVHQVCHDCGGEETGKLVEETLGGLTKAMEEMATITAQLQDSPNMNALALVPDQPGVASFADVTELIKAVGVGLVAETMVGGSAPPDVLATTKRIITAFSVVRMNGGTCHVNGGPHHVIGLRGSRAAVELVLVTMAGQCRSKPDPRQVPALRLLLDMYIRSVPEPAGAVRGAVKLFPPQAPEGTLHVTDWGG